MFGYVIPDRGLLTKEQQDRYQTAYCGLCRRIGTRYGTAGRFTLSYDLTFLNLLLCSLYEGEGEKEESRVNVRCPAHPVRPVGVRWSDPTDYCADLSILLHYYRAEDHWNDDRSISAKAAMKLLAKDVHTASERLPRESEAIRHSLAELSALESAQSDNLDAVSDCFGAMMAEFFDWKQDIWSKDLKRTGYSLGKFIYLLDAWDDLPRDVRRGRFNPLQNMSRQPGYEENIRSILEMLAADCARSFERLPCVADSDLLHNILYSGIWLKYNCGHRSDTAK